MDEQILAIARELGAPQEQHGVLLLMIQAARQELEGALRPGLTPQDCGPAFPLGAAMLALSALESAQGGREVTSFSAGDLPIHRSTGSTDSLRCQALRLMRPYLRSDGLCLLGVRG